MGRILIPCQREKKQICIDIICEFETFLSKPVGNVSLSIIGGIISAAIFAFVLTFWQKPKLRFISETIGTSDPDKQFYHICVKNYGHTTAYNCKVDIEFINKQSGERIQIKNSKWVQNPEPVTIHLLDMVPKKVPHDSLLKNTWYMSIPPNSSQAFALLLKYRGEENCYAFNGENYIEGFQKRTYFRMESRRISQGEYVANLTVVGDNVRGSGSYYIYNSGPMFSDVTITPY